MHEVEWDEIIGKIPELGEKDSRAHISIAYGGRLLPFNPEDERVGHLIRLKATHVTEVLGPPNVGKTTLISSLSGELSRQEFPHQTYAEVFPDIKPVWDWEEESFNLAQQLSAASLLVQNTALSRTFVEYQNEKLKIYDRGIFSPLTFSLTRSRLRRGLLDFGSGLQLEIVKKLCRWVDTIVIINAGPETSIKRGSDMNTKFLQELYQVHLEFPEYIAKLTAEELTPITIIQINGESPPESCCELTLKTLGTILRTGLISQQSYKEMLANLSDS